MISLSELNPHKYLTSDKIDKNLHILLDRMNKVRVSYAAPMVITSGLRSFGDQMRINPSAPSSAHLTGEACDVLDKDGSLWDWVFKNLDLMKEIGLWFENPNYTHHNDNSGWVHFQVRSPGSGHRIFIPSPAPPLNAHFWDGNYDKKFD